MILLAWDDGALRLLHVDLLLQVTVEVRGLDVHVMQLPVVVSRECNEHADGGVAGDWCIGLVVVYAVLLRVALGHQTSLVLDDGAVGATLDLQHESAADGLAVRG